MWDVAREFIGYLVSLSKKWVLWLFLAFDAIGLIAEMLWPELKLPPQIKWGLAFLGLSWAGFGVYHDLKVKIRLLEFARKDDFREMQKDREDQKKRDALRKILGCKRDLNLIITLAFTKGLDEDWQETQRTLYREIDQVRQLFRDDQMIYDTLNMLGGVVANPNSLSGRQIASQTLDRCIEDLDRWLNALELI